MEHVKTFLVGLLVAAVITICFLLFIVLPKQIALPILFIILVICLVVVIYILGDLFRK